MVQSHSRPLLIFQPTDARPAQNSWRAPTTGQRDGAHNAAGKEWFGAAKMEKHGGF